MTMLTEATQHQEQHLEKFVCLYLDMIASKSTKPFAGICAEKLPKQIYSMITEVIWKLQ